MVFITRKMCRINGSEKAALNKMRDVCTEKRKNIDEHYPLMPRLFGSNRTCVPFYFHKGRSEPLNKQRVSIFQFANTKNTSFLCSTKKNIVFFSFYSWLCREYSVRSSEIMKPQTYFEFFKTNKMGFITKVVLIKNTLSFVWIMKLDIFRNFFFLMFWSIFLRHQFSIPVLHKFFAPLSWTV